MSTSTCANCGQTVEIATAMKGLAYEGSDKYYHNSCFMTHIRESVDRVQRGMPAAQNVVDFTN